MSRRLSSQGACLVQCVTTALTFVLCLWHVVGARQADAQLFPEDRTPVGGQMTAGSLPRGMGTLSQNWSPQQPVAPSQFRPGTYTPPSTFAIGGNGVYQPTVVNNQWNMNGNAVVSTIYSCAKALGILGEPRWAAHAQLVVNCGYNMNVMACAKPIIKQACQLTPGPCKLNAVVNCAANAGVNLLGAAYTAIEDDLRVSVNGPTATGNFSQDVQTVDQHCTSRAGNIYACYSCCSQICQAFGQQNGWRSFESCQARCQGSCSRAGFSN